MAEDNREGRKVNESLQVNARPKLIQEVRLREILDKRVDVCC